MQNVEQDRYNVKTTPINEGSPIHDGASAPAQFYEYRFLSLSP